MHQSIVASVSYSANFLVFLIVNGIMVNVIYLIMLTCGPLFCFFYLNVTDQLSKTPQLYGNYDGDE